MTPDIYALQAFQLQDIANNQWIDDDSCYKKDVNMDFPYPIVKELKD